MSRFFSLEEYFAKPACLFVYFNMISLFIDPQTPVPDYEEGTVDSQESYEKYFAFAKNFGTVINNIKLIGIAGLVNVVVCSVAHIKPFNSL